MRRILFLVVLFLGCSPADECDGPFVACDGNVAVTCASRSFDDLQSYFDLQREPCGTRSCHTSNGFAFCALDPNADPNCPQNLRDSNFASGCVNGVLTTWRFGASIATQTCPDALTCLTLDGACSGEAYCVASTTPEPLCATPFNRCVDDNVIAYCRCGFQVDVHACENPDRRCVIEDTIAVCRP